MLTFVRRLRHGPLAFLGPVWLAFGHCFRAVVRHVPGLTIWQKIGPFGPFRLVPEFTFSNFEAWGGAHNKGFRYCVEVCRGKSCVFDVGAHIGLTTLPLASVLAAGADLHAFEPAEANARILRRHLAINNFHGVHVVEALVGESDRDGVGFYESAGPHGQNSIVLKGEHTLKSEWGGYSRTERPQISLDSYCQRYALTPQVIKIDVEGGEIGVLRGARATLARCCPLIILSVHPREISLTGESLATLRKLLDDMRYEIRDIHGNPVTELKMDEYVVAPRESANATPAATS